MNEVKELAQQVTDSSSEFWSTIEGYLPKLLAAVVLLVVALIAAKLAQAIVEHVLKLARVDKLVANKQVSKTLKSAEVKVDVVSLVGRTTFWVVIVIFALSIAEVLGLTAMSDVLHEILVYLPSVLAAVIVLTVTIAGARLVRDLVTVSLHRMRVSFARNVASVAFYVLLVFGFVMAVDQLGFDTTILTANLTVMVAGVVFALALAFGLGGKDTAKKVVDEAYGNYKKSIHKK